MTALSDADVNTFDVVQVVRTGGSSAIPLFVDMVSSTFNRAVMTQRPPYTTVVQGLGHFAQGLWG
jgi:molecular chaperone DnaK (HSP70)